MVERKRNPGPVPIGDDRPGVSLALSPGYEGASTLARNALTAAISSQTTECGIG